ncbi:MAG TPA: hypothetical protein V6C76_02025 [Drouetiella sp.]
MSEKDVCRGQTSYDKLSIDTNNHLREHRKDVVTQDGRTGTVEEIYGLKPEFGTKEFPNSLLGSRLATKEHEKSLNPEQKTMLTEMRKYPNSELLGVYSGMAKLKRLSDDQKADFSKALVEAGCSKGKIGADGSIEFEKKK